MKKQILLSAVLICISVFSAAAQKEPVDYVNPFVGTTNYGTTNPGALTPHGMMSVTPFNVMGVPEGDKDKDKQWWSTPYEFNNKYLTGFAHVNLSGVGCPELGSLLLMPTPANWMWIIIIMEASIKVKLQIRVIIPIYWINTM